MEYNQFLTSEMIRKLFHYFLSGVISYLLKLLLTIIFVDYFGWNEFFSYPLAIGITMVIMFWYLASITFRIEEDIEKRAISYIITLAISYVLDIFIMIAITSTGLDYRISLTISTIVIAVIKFFVFNFFVFRKNS